MRAGPSKPDLLCSSVIFAVAGVASVVSLWISGIMIVAWLCTFGMSKK
jgi:hypothetical protein